MSNFGKTWYCRNTLEFCGKKCITCAVTKSFSFTPARFFCWCLSPKDEGGRCHSRAFANQTVFQEIKSWSGMLVSSRRLLESCRDSFYRRHLKPHHKKKKNGSPHSHHQQFSWGSRSQIHSLFSQTLLQTLCFAGFTPSFWGSSPAGRSALASCHIYFLVCHFLYAETKCPKVSGKPILCCLFYSQLMNFEKSWKKMADKTVMSVLPSHSCSSPSLLLHQQIPSYLDTPVSGLKSFPVQQLNSWLHHLTCGSTSDIKYMHPKPIRTSKLQDLLWWKSCF